jgi:hypothetical protein
MDILHPIHFPWMDAYVQIHPEGLENAILQLDIPMGWMDGRIPNTGNDFSWIATAFAISTARCWLRARIRAEEAARLEAEVRDQEEEANRLAVDARNRRRKRIDWRRREGNWMRRDSGCSGKPRNCWIWPSWSGRVPRSSRT